MTHANPAILLLFLALVQVRTTGETTTVKEQIRTIPTASIVEVRLRDKGRLLGHLRDVWDSGFSLQLIQVNSRKGVEQPRKIEFNEVESIRYPAKGQQDMSQDLKNVAVLGIIAVIVLIVLGIAGAAFLFL